MKKGDLVTIKDDKGSLWFDKGDKVEWTGKTDGALHEFQDVSNPEYKCWLRIDEVKPYRTPYEKELFHAFQESQEMVEKLSTIIYEDNISMDEINYVQHCETRSEELTKEFE